MSSTTSRTSLTSLLAVLTCSEVALLVSDVSDGVRYGVGAVIVLAILVLVARIAKTKPSR